MKKLLFITGLSMALLLSAENVKAQNVGETAPDFLYTDLTGDTIRLSNYHGKVVFIYSFGNGCPFCLGIGPDVEKKIQQVYGAKQDFQAVGLDTWDNSSSVATVGQFKSTTGITFPLAIKAGSFEPLYKTTYDRAHVVDREGVLRYKGSSRVQNELDQVVAFIETLFTSTSVPDLDREIGISNIFPNPAPEYASIRFVLEKAERVRIRIYNPIGQEIKFVTDERYPAGKHVNEFTTADLSPGMYLVKFDTPSSSITKKFQVTR